MLTNSTLRAEFIEKIIEKETLYQRELAYDKITGLSIPEIPINERTGMPGEIQKISAKSQIINEALHIALICKVLEGKSTIYELNQVYEILKKKISSLKKLDLTLNSESLYFSLIALSEAL